MIDLLFIAAWFGLGYVGYLLTRWWWTADFDWTTVEATLGLAFMLTGPLNLGIGLLLAGPSWIGEHTKDRVLKERRR